MTIKRVNEKGNALLGALAAVVGLGIVSSGMIVSYESFVRQSHVTFVRSAFSSLEGSFRYLANQPYSFNCTDKLGGLANCTVDKAYLERRLGPSTPTATGFQIRKVFPSAECPKGMQASTCGFLIEVSNNLLTVNDSGGKTFGLMQAKITYEGAEASFLPPVLLPTQEYRTGPVTDALIYRNAVPLELLQAQVFDCNKDGSASTPVFTGFTPSGKPDCRGFDSCPIGSYVTGVNFDTLKVTCSSLATPDKNIDCSQAKSGKRQAAISTLIWNANGIVTHDCEQVPQAPINQAPNNCPPTAGEQADGSCFYSNRWCYLASSDPNSTIGFSPGDTGAQTLAGCGDDKGVFQPPGTVIQIGPTWRKCMSGPYADYPLPANYCQPAVGPPNCPDQVFSDAQKVSSGHQNGNVSLTVNFQSAVDKIPSNCKYSTVTINLLQFGNYSGSCQAPATFQLSPGGGPGYYGFMGNKTSMVTAVVNGGSAYVTDTVANYGGAGGNMAAACLSDITVTVHSVPK